MRQRTNRDRPRAGGAENYWRRRVLALAGGLAALGIAAWAMSGTFSGPPGTGAAAVTGASGQPGPGGTASAGTTATSAGSTRGVPGGRASAGTDARRKAARPASGRGRRPARGLPAACPPGEVALRLHQRQATYGAGAWPSFTVAVTSSAARPCTFSTGSRPVSLVIRSGRSPLWDSAYCASGPAIRQTVLTRGSPAVLHFRWDRRSASPGCRPPGHPARPGPYLATAVSGGLTSNPLIFVLNGPGVVVP